MSNRRREVAANRCYANIDGLADRVVGWITSLTRAQVRRKGGLLSGRFWLSV